jgi:hypothetical protein
VALRVPSVWTALRAGGADEGTGLFGSRRWEWTREELSDIVSGPSNMCINDQPVIELHIYPNDGKRLTVLGNHFLSLRKGAC